MPKSRILVVDDEVAIRESLRMTLEYEGYECLLAATGQEALSLAERETPDLVLLDVKMPGMDGIDVLERLRAMNEALPVIVVSGHGRSARPSRRPRRAPSISSRSRLPAIGSW